MEPRGIVHIFGGGTFIDVAPHLSLAARGTGRTAKYLEKLFLSQTKEGGTLEGYEVQTHLTTQADPTSPMKTPADVSTLLDDVLADPLSKIVVMSCAMVDFGGTPVVLHPDNTTSVLDRNKRLRTSSDDGGPMATPYLLLEPLPKIIRRVREKRKDIFLVGFKQTHGADEDDQFQQGLKLLKQSSCNLVFANDAVTKGCMVITPEQARYHDDAHFREEALAGLVDMASLRHKNGTFTRSTIVRGVPVSWTSPSVPESLRTVVNHCISRGAYKPFLGSTVGHFAVKLSDKHFLTSRRKTDFNKLGQVGLVAVEAKGDHEVIAYGSKPSVGGQSQRIVFREHPDLDCIVHFHCPLRSDAVIKLASQRSFECGSHQCGKNTSDHLVEYESGIWAVMLDKHGPNIVFNQKIDPQRVISFIEHNWDLSRATDRYSHVPPYHAENASAAAP